MSWAAVAQQPPSLPKATPPPASDNTLELAKKTQNPIADLISLPFQNNTLFGVGPDDDAANVLNIKPVIPLTVGDWNIVNRTIVPLIYLPDVAAGLPELPEGVSDLSFILDLAQDRLDFEGPMEQIELPIGDVPVDRNDFCGAGVCGAGLGPIIPLMGLGLMRLGIRRRRARRGGRNS